MDQAKTTLTDRLEGHADYERLLDGDIDLAALKPSFDRIVRVAMTLFGAPDGEVTILRPGEAPWRSKGGGSPNTVFTELVMGRREVVWVEDLPADTDLASLIEPEVAAVVRFGAGAPILLGGEAVLFVERGGRSLVPLVEPDPEWLRPVLAALVEWVRAGVGRRLAVERFDGSLVQETNAIDLLVEAGFLVGPKRAVLRP